MKHFIIYKIFVCIPMTFYNPMQVSIQTSPTQMENTTFVQRLVLIGLLKVIDIQNLSPISCGTALVCITRYQMVEICV